MNKLVLILFLPLVFFYACNKGPDDDPNAPPTPTQSGVDILYCKVNGTSHTYKGKGTVSHDDGVEAYNKHYPDSGQTIIISGDNTHDYDDAILLYVNVASQTGSFTPVLNRTYVISQYPPFDYSHYALDDVEYYGDSTRSTISFSRYDDDIVAGLFEFHGTNNNGDSVHITEGFFDILKN